MKNTTFICDRCGKKTAWENQPNVDIHVGDLKIEHVKNVVIYSRTGYKRKIDLCEDCMRKFDEWMSNN